MFNRFCFCQANLVLQTNESDRFLSLLRDCCLR